jgi:hypothetical protein
MCQLMLLQQQLLPGVGNDRAQASSHVLLHVDETLLRLWITT